MSTTKKSNKGGRAAREAGASAAAAETTVRDQRRIQTEQDRRDAAPSAKKAAAKKPMQAGARPHPEKPPAQHLAKPGHEADLQLAPQFMAPDYKGSGKLEGFAAIVTGGDSGIGRAVAVLFAREGADVTVAYLDEHEDAAETKRCIEAEGRRCVLVAGDVAQAEVRRQGRRQDDRRRSASSTCWSTTPPSRSTPNRSRTSPTSSSTRPSAPTSSATSTWPGRRCRT